MSDSDGDRSAKVLPENARLHDQYVVEDILGAGSFGITYRALDEQLGETVAIKEYFPRQLATRGQDGRTVRPHSEGDKEDFQYGRERFLREGRILAQFDHPNIVGIRTYFEENGTGYLVMDFYEGQTLAKRLEEAGGTLPENEAVSIVNSVLTGLEKVHEEDILHRDIDPQNIYLPRAGEPLLLDFGAARVAVGERTKSLSVILKPGFAPYEQYHSGGDQGPWTDVYACAATLYRCFTGETPPAATRRISEEPTPLAELPESTSPSVREAVLQGLQVWPEDRPQSVAALRALLEGDTDENKRKHLTLRESEVENADESRDERADLLSENGIVERVVNWARQRSGSIASVLGGIALLLIGVGVYYAAGFAEPSYDELKAQGAEAFKRAKQQGDQEAFQEACSRFKKAINLRRSAEETALTAAYACLNAKRGGEGDMTEVIPLLERYVELADAPEKNAYDVLTALYLKNGDTQKAIDLLERARKDLSSRPTYFRVAGAEGLSYSGTVEEGGSAREVEGSVPDSIPVANDGKVTGIFQKRGEGRLEVGLLYDYQGGTVADTTVTSGAVQLSADLSQGAPLEQLEGRLLNAYNQAGQVQKAITEYRRQVAEHPGNATYRYNYGSLLLNADRYAEAITQLKKTVELVPENAKAQYNLGAAYTNAGRRVNDSLQVVEDSLSALRSGGEANRTLGESLAEKKEKLAQKKRDLYRQAIPPLERARQLSSSGSNEKLRQGACRALVTAYVQTDQTEKAKQREECAGIEGQADPPEVTMGGDSKGDR